MSNIKPSTIDKHLIVFNEIKTICDNHSNLHLQTIANNYKVSTRPFYAAVNLNYFRKIELEKYECLIGKFERTHIRKILEYTNNQYKNVFKQNWPLLQKNQNTNEINIDNHLNLEVNSITKIENTIPPTIEMVEKYCNERRNDVNPAKFISYYEQKGWKIGKDKMKNWKMAIHTWEHKNYNNISVKKLSDYSDQELVDELKRRGYTGIMEIKNTISF